ncbi:hypothetical protein [Kingella potus]|uniref:hypothetical protein n=1 Tax=Kingella potus TaxID=265175 RepID=UPI001FD5A659|nr:hypothetical protein [Kingella potus]UOP00283.1 hypothetical protein LVJ84_10265 [Kingella potus]
MLAAPTLCYNFRAPQRGGFFNPAAQAACLITETTMFPPRIFHKLLPNSAALVLLLAFAAPVQAASVNSRAARQAVEAYKSGNYGQLFRLLRPFAEQGDATAQTGLGALYAEGRA